MSILEPLTIECDEEADTVTICGVRYSCDLFRQFGHAEPGTWLRIERRRDGVLTLARAALSIGRTFDAIVGKTNA